MPPNASDLEPEDELIVVRCQLGERAAFDLLIRRWSPLLYGHARRLAGDDEQACDHVQYIWLGVLRGSSGLRDAAQFRAWLFGIAHRAFADRLRKRYSEPIAVALEHEPLAASPFDDEMLVEVLLRHLGRLPPPERELLTLFHLQELSLEEVSAVLDIPVGTVKSRLFRARAALRALMRPEEIRG